MTAIRWASLLSLSCVLLSACAVGPDYQRPTFKAPEQFRYQEGWQAAKPADDQLPSQWWKLYQEPELDKLVEGLTLDNQNLAAAEARMRQAQVLAEYSAGTLYPQLGSSAGKTRSGSDQSTTQSYNLGLNMAWEVDVWGKLRRNLEAVEADYQASSAELAALRLSLQVQLVSSYLQIRLLDQQLRLYEQSIAAYERSLTLTENQYKAGMVPRSDVSQALSQLRNAQAQWVQLKSQRGQMENAVAVLVGKAPAEVSVTVQEREPALPLIPTQVPADLLERRADVAAAERAVMAANARIGVAEAAYYPSLMLSANGGYSGSSFANLLDLPNRYWSVGPQLALSLFDGGARKIDSEQAIASYDATVADYRQTVLVSFQEVEDALLQLHWLAKEKNLSAEALAADEETQRMVENQYKAGMVSFLNVASAQSATLSTARSHLSLKNNQLQASLLLIAAIGGGWQGLQEP